MSREVVEWLRDHARRCEQVGIAHSHGNGGRNSEVEYALKFADMIEQRFVPSSSIAKLASAPSTFPPTRIYAATGSNRRRRGPKFR